MADRSRNFVGARLRVITSEGGYEGTVHSIDAEKRKLTLTKGEELVTFSNATMSTPHRLPEEKRNKRLSHRVIILRNNLFTRFQVFWWSALYWLGDLCYWLLDRYDVGLLRTKKDMLKSTVSMFWNSKHRYTLRETDVCRVTFVLLLAICIDFNRLRYNEDNTIEMNRLI